MSRSEEGCDGQDHGGQEPTGASQRVLRPIPDTRGGEVLLRASWLGTVLLAITCALAIASTALEVVLVAVSSLMFVVGVLAFGRAFLFAVSVRREDLIGVGGLYFLAGSAPRRVQANLLGSFAVQVGIGLVTAAVRPYTALAFAVLAPLYGLGLTGMWGAIHGTFPTRPVAGSER